jgi:hypothetical protein
VNTFNRIVLIVICVLLVIATIGVIALAWTIPNRTVNWLADAVQWIDDNDGDLEKALLTTASAFIGLVAVIVLLIELIPRRGPAVQVTGLASGEATLSAAAIGQRIEEAVVQVPHVSEVRADVKSRKKGVLVALDLQVDPEANLATVTDEACQVATEVLTERVHVALIRPPTARLHYRELRLHRGNGSTPRQSGRVVGRAPQRDTQLEADLAEARSPFAIAVPAAPLDTPAPPEPPELPEHLRRLESANEEPEPPEEPDEAKEADEEPDADKEKST